MDFDPRDFDDPRDEARHEPNRSQAPARQERRSRDRDGGDTRSLGRGGGGDRQGAEERPRDDARRDNREREGPERNRTPGDAFTRHVDLPRGPDRERVIDRDRVYTLRGSEARTLSTVGAFRVVSSSDLRDHVGGCASLRSGDLRHLREQGLIETVRVPGYRDHAVALTRAGHSLLEAHRYTRSDRGQTFHARLVRSREREHDLQVYRAYERAEERLRELGAQVERIVLDHELKSEYQRWRHEDDTDRGHHDGRDGRSPGEVEAWAAEHDLPYFDEEVHFPDVRVEYVEPDGRWAHEDIEVVTPHYRGAHGASVARAGFSTYAGESLSLSGTGGGGRGGRGGRSVSIMEELLR